ncbi:MAG: PTS sugar transporter subunit IIB [Deltaproteobacteria bacterium]|nr:PTS sugar transporter subunit IIB [Deltaproteobacteria bacterium]
MIILVRVDDRLLHGQIICSWVPHLKADALIVASDYAAEDVLTNQIMQACSCNELSVVVMKVDDAVRRARLCARNVNERAIVILGDIKDALRLYNGGVRFTSLNIGNVHHERDGRALTASVILNREDEACIGELEALGITIDIRDVPGRKPVSYRHNGEGRKSGV